MDHGIAARPLNSTLQRRLWCPCGSADVRSGGLCPRCQRAAWHSRRYFAGHREAVLTRDGFCCRGCGALNQRVVHHRRPGRHATAWLITLCPACHARIHRLRANRRWLPSAVLVLWSEQHAGVPVQLQLAIEAAAAGREAAAAA
jgi:hypothetical protein